MEKDVVKDNCEVAVESKLCAEPLVAADLFVKAEAEPVVLETLPEIGAEEVLLPLQPAYKLNKVKQKMTMEDLEAAAEEEVDDDPDYEEEEEEEGQPVKRAPKRGGRGKRKRSSSSDSNGKEDEDAIFYPECSMEVGCEEVKQKKKKGGQVKKKVKPARARKKNKKGIMSEEEEEGEGDIGLDNEGDGPVITKEEGPLDMNLFALGFEETEVKDIVVKKSMTQGERLTMKV